MAKTPGSKTKLSTYLNLDSHVYIIIFSDGFFYIGKSSMDPDTRISMHKNAKNNSLICKKFKEVKEGLVTYRHKVVFTGDYDAALEHERKLIKAQKSLKCLNQQGVSKYLKETRKEQEKIQKEIENLLA